MAFSAPDGWYLISAESGGGEGWRAYAELDGDGEVIAACFFGNGITASNTRKIDKGRLDDTVFALCGFQQPFSKAKASARYQENCYG